MCRRQYANDACNRGTAGKFNVYSKLFKTAPLYLIPIF